MRSAAFLRSLVFRKHEHWLAIGGRRADSSDGRLTGSGFGLVTRGVGRSRESSSPSQRRTSCGQNRCPIAVEMSREGISLIVIQRQLGHADLAITSRYLQGIDSTEIIQAVHQRPEPMIPAGRQLGIGR